MSVPRGWTGFQHHGQLIISSTSRCSADVCVLVALLGGSQTGLDMICRGGRGGGWSWGGGCGAAFVTCMSGHAPCYYSGKLQAGRAYLEVLVEQTREAATWGGETLQWQMS